METLEQQEPVTEQQTLVGNSEIDESRVSESDPIQESKISGFEASKLFETEIFVKEVDEKAIGDISVGKISEGRGKMTRKRGRKSKELEKTATDEEIALKNDELESMVKMGLSEDEEEEGDEEEEEDVSNEFSVGDFVWVKIKSYPWWPGQIFSPLDASAKAGKYRRRNRLLVACFGDGTFAWCYPSQLKGFRENFEKFENQSSSKNFVIAVDEAVNEFGKSLDFEMGCSCLPEEHKPAKSVVMNAGIKEGVVVPDGGIGELSITQVEPAEFLSHLKYIAQVVSVNSRFELLALKCRLSGFYRAKGYNRLMEYHLPMRIVISEEENGQTGGDHRKDQTANVNGSPVEADWLSSSADRGVGSTGITMSRRMTGLSEDMLLNSKKQRNVSDLMLGNLDAKDDSISEASPIEETGSAKRGRPKKIKEPIPSEVGSDTAEEVAVSQEMPSGEIKENTTSNVGHENGVSDEVTTSTKARGRPKKITEPMPCKVGDGEVGHANGATESGKPGGRLKRKQNTHSEVGNDAVKESGVSSKQATPASTDKKLKSSNVGDATGATKEGSVSVKGRGRPKKRKEGSNEDVLEETKSKASEVGSEEDVIKELPFSGKKSMELRRRKKTEDSEVQKDADVAEELPKRKEKPGSKLGSDSVIIGEGSNDGKQTNSLKRPKEIKLPEHSVTGANSDDEDDDSGAKDGSKSNVSSRERKKSKYLSPPYTLLGQWQKSATDDSRKKSPRSPHISQELGKASGLSVPLPPMVKCIGIASETEPSKDVKLESSKHGCLSPLPIESNVSAHEILSDFRSAALDPLYLTEKQSDDTVKGFLTKFRSSSYQEGSYFTVYNNQLGSGGSRKRVSFEGNGNDTNETGNPISEEASEVKKRKKKNDEVLSSPKKPADSNGEVSVAALLLTFASGASLPSKDEIITAFRPFGDLKESETEVIEDSGCAQVVFANRADAEEAYKNTDKISSFGSSVASYRLRYLSAKNASPSPMKGVSTASESQVSVVPPPLLSVRENLQKADTVLEKLWDNLSSDMKTSFGAEIKGFLDKVTSMGDTTSS
ncbi:hypothetical protein ACHQM5_008306 [Ranunculus cassubicifolius]